jgi:hypothetical protein
MISRGMLDHRWEMLPYVGYIKGKVISKLMFCFEIHYHLISDFNKLYVWMADEGGCKNIPNFQKIDSAIRARFKFYAFF